jgi:hypothetical protein
MWLDAQVKAYNSTQLSFTWGSSTTGHSNTWISPSYGFGAGNWSLTFQAVVPIQGWTSSFNPVLSMPLVDIGGNTEEYRYLNVNQASSKTFRLIGRSTGTEAVNTISNLGTVNNDTVNGWYFQANQRVKVSLSTGYSRSTAIAGQGIVKYPSSFGSPSTIADNGWGHSQWNPYVIGGGQDSHAANYQTNVAASFIMEPNDYVQIIQDGSNNTTDSAKAGIQLLVEKDFSNTNMAHIIKPAVCILKDIKMPDTSSGDGGETSVTWDPRDLNTIEGESWFVTLANPLFTLEPGAYEISFSTPVLISNNCQSRLWDVTNGAAVGYSSQGYSAAAYWSSVENLFNTTVTIGASTQYRVETIAQTVSAYGYGYRSDEIVSVYTQVKIRKLK